MNRDFKGIWIPKEIWLDTKLNWSEKILLTEIDSLSSLGECFATNEYFANFMGLSKDRISKLITNLVKKKVLKSKLKYLRGKKQVEKRILTVVKMGGYSYKQLGGIGENNYTPIGENAEDNNTSINNTININNNVDLEKNDLEKLHNEIISLFKKQPEQYRLTDKRKKVLLTRLKDTGEANILLACRNLSKSRFHSGDNDRGWVAEPYWCLTSYEKAEEWSNKKVESKPQDKYKTPDQLFKPVEREVVDPDRIKHLRDNLLNKIGVHNVR